MFWKRSPSVTPPASMSEAHLPIIQPISNASQSFDTTLTALSTILPIIANMPPIFDTTLTALSAVLSIIANMPPIEVCNLTTMPDSRPNDVVVTSTSGLMTPKRVATVPSKPPNVPMTPTMPLSAIVKPEIATAAAPAAPDSGLSFTNSAALFITSPRNFGIFDSGSSSGENADARLTAPAFISSTAVFQVVRIFSMALSSSSSFFADSLTWPDRSMKPLSIISKRPSTVLLDMPILAKNFFNAACSASLLLVSSES